MLYRHVVPCGERALFLTILLQVRDESTQALESIGRICVLTDTSLVSDCRETNSIIRKQLARIPDFLCNGVG
jgi:hypothetical protein